MVFYKRKVFVTSKNDTMTKDMTKNRDTNAARALFTWQKKGSCGALQAVLKMYDTVRTLKFQ